MQVEVTTRLKPADNLVILDIALTPRGSGNRHAARRLGRQFEQHADLKEHIEKVVVGSSRVVVHFRNSLAFLKAIRSVKRGTLDVPGQLQMFGQTA